jgi:ankyrin repeat protein
MKALRVAAYEGNFSELKRLCKVERNRVNEAGPDTRRTALHWGAVAGHTKIVSYLLKAAQAKVDSLDLELNTPLNLVIQDPELPLQKKLSVIDILLAHQANPTRANQYGQTPLMNLEALRDRIPDSHYFQRKAIDSTIRRIKESIHKGVSVSIVNKLYVPQAGAALNGGTMALRFRS